MNATPATSDPSEAKLLLRAPLSQWTTFGVGGPAAQLVEVEEVGALRTALARADHEGAPVLVLGGGSNVLISDEGFPGTVLHIGITGRTVAADDDTVIVSVGAGEHWAPFVLDCVSEGFSGVECLAGIPGLVGGTPVQNVGAYGQEVSRTIEAVTVWDRLSHRVESLAPGACRFGYRDSVFKRRQRYVVTSVSFRLQRSRRAQPVRYRELAEALGCPLGGTAAVEAVTEAVLALRRRKGMVLDPADPDTRSVGSFFTNPVLDTGHMAHFRRVAPDAPSFPDPGGFKIPAAWLVEQAGFRRGYQHGKAAISGKHALALTAPPGATAADVLSLAREVRAGVKERFGVLLQPEPVLVGLHL
jgi:UDP-N-acetylmuramate dehydrogenase